jgi:predicted TIM-barrel enzyme
MTIFEDQIRLQIALLRAREQTVADVREAADPGVPVLSNTGAAAATVAQCFKFADGCVLGPGPKRDGYTWNEVDPERVKRFVDAAHSA